MKFKRLTWSNFLSYGKNKTSLDFDQESIINVIGTNGEGKSVFIDALHFVLTGKSFRGIKVSQIANNINKKNCLVELEVEKGSKKVKIVRGLNPKIFSITIDNKKIDEQLNTDQQKYIEQLLGFNSKTLKYTIIMSSMNYSPFLKMTAAEKRLFVDDILNISDFTNLSAYVKQKFSILKTKITDTEYNIKSLESNLSLIKEMNLKVIKNSDEQVAILKEKIDKLNNDIEELKKEDFSNIKMFEEEYKKLEVAKKEELESKRTYYNDIIKQYKEEHSKVLSKLKIDMEDELEKKKKIFSKKLSEKKDKKDSLSEKIDKMKLSLKEKQEEYHEQSKALNSDLKLIENNISQQDKQKKFLNENSECPSCKRDIDDEFKNEEFNKLDEKISLLNNEKDNILNKIASLVSLNDKIEEFEKKIIKYEEKYEVFNSRLSQFKIECNDKLNDIKNSFKATINNEDNKYNDNINRCGKELSNEREKINEKYDNEINSKKTSHSELKIKQENNLKTVEDKNSILEDYIKQIERLKNPEITEVKDESKVLNEININNKNLSELLDKKRIFEISITLLSDKGFKTFVVNKYIPILNKYVNEYLDILEAHYRLKFDAQLNEQIVAKGYEKLSYDSFSSGEKARCDLALLFAFLELSKKKSSIDSNLLILDEVADNSLDKNGVYGVLNIINRLKTKGYTIFVISHRDEIKEEFDLTYEAKKDIFSNLKEKNK